MKQCFVRLEIFSVLQLHPSYLSRWWCMLLLLRFCFLQLHIQLAQATEILYEKLDTMNTSCIERCVYVYISLSKLQVIWWLFSTSLLAATNSSSDYTTWYDIVTCAQKLAEASLILACGFKATEKALKHLCSEEKVLLRNPWSKSWCGGNDGIHMTNKCHEKEKEMQRRTEGWKHAPCNAVFDG